MEGEKRKFVSSSSSPESCLLLPLLLLLIVAATPFPPIRLFRFCLEHLKGGKESQKQQCKRENGKKCTQERWKKEKEEKENGDTLPLFRSHAKSVFSPRADVKRRGST